MLILPEIAQLTEPACGPTNGRSHPEYDSRTLSTSSTSALPAPPAPLSGMALGVAASLSMRVVKELGLMTMPRSGRHGGNKEPCEHCGAGVDVVVNIEAGAVAAVVNIKAGAAAAVDLDRVVVRSVGVAASILSILSIMHNSIVILT
jgi:hypothetical protein